MAVGQRQPIAKHSINLPGQANEQIKMNKLNRGKTIIVSSDVTMKPHGVKDSAFRKNKSQSSKFRYVANKGSVQRKTIGL